MADITRNFCEVGTEGGEQCLRWGTVRMRISGENTLLCEYHTEKAVEVLAERGVNIPVQYRNHKRVLDEQIQRNWEERVRYAY